MVSAHAHVVGAHGGGDGRQQQRQILAARPRPAARPCPRPARRQARCIPAARALAGRAGAAVRATSRPRGRSSWGARGRRGLRRRPSRPAAGALVGRPCRGRARMLVGRRCAPWELAAARLLGSAGPPPRPGAGTAEQRARGQRQVALVNMLRIRVQSRRTPHGAPARAAQLAQLKRARRRRGVVPGFRRARRRVTPGRLVRRPAQQERVALRVAARRECRLLLLLAAVRHPLGSAPAPACGCCRYRHRGRHGRAARPHGGRGGRGAARARPRLTIRAGALRRGELDKAKLAHVAHAARHAAAGERAAGDAHARRGRRRAGRGRQEAGRAGRRGRRAGAADERDRRADASRDGRRGQAARDGEQRADADAGRADLGGAQAALPGRRAGRRGRAGRQQQLVRQQPLQRGCLRGSIGLGSRRARLGAGRRGPRRALLNWKMGCDAARTCRAKREHAPFRQGAPLHAYWAAQLVLVLLHTRMRRAPARLHSSFPRRTLKQQDPWRHHASITAWF